MAFHESSPSGKARAIFLWLGAVALAAGCRLDSRVAPRSGAQAEGSAGEADTRTPDAAGPYIRTDRPDAEIDLDAGAGTDAGDDAGANDGATDACAVDHGGCDLLVTCQSQRGRAACGACPHGYDDVHGDGTACRDIDECQSDRGGCDAAHGVCVNEPGSRECRCEAGFHGDGFQCSSHATCTRASDCAAEASCSAQGSLHLCNCNPGYTGDGTHCSDVDECAQATDDCSPEPRACHNTPGGFECRCPAGYTGTGRGPDGCQDSDECASLTHDCAASAACVNDAPGFHCACPPGYRGDGHGAQGCIDIDECTQGSSGCDPLRACINDPGSSHCGDCPAGYRPDGPSACAACACYERSVGQACSSARDSVPADATRVLSDDRHIDERTLFGLQVMLPAGAHITGFGATKAGDETPRIAMGLYNDAGGAPGALVTRSVARAFSNPRVLLPVQEDAGCLPAGTYWLLALVNDDLTIGEAESGPQVAYAHVKLDQRGVQLPARWPDDGDIDGSRTLNLYVSFDHP